VRFREPVPPAELPFAMNACDVGVFCMPPININARYALPNKFFDFVQARLAVAVGPAEEMARLTSELGLGPVSADFSEAAFTQALAGLDAAAVSRYKAAAHASAKELSSERDEQVERELLARLLAA
jgi:hypothetical protein